VLAMVVTTAVERVDADERRRIADFFARLARPVDEDPRPEGAEPSGFSPLTIITQVTAGTGGLLLLASAVQTRGTGQAINVGAGLAVLLVAAGCHWLNRNVTPRRPVRAINRT
jgi:hypothetical protein